MKRDGLFVLRRRQYRAINGADKSAPLSINPEQIPRPKGRGCVEGFIRAAIFIVLILFFSVNLGQLGRSIPDEKRYYQSTREMVSSGDYMTPRYHGALRFQKPILSYWLIIASYKAFGVNWFGARFPSAAAAALTILLVFSLAGSFFGKRDAFFAAAALATCELYYMYARFSAPDMIFVFFITLALFLFLRAYYSFKSGRAGRVRLFMWPAYAAMALGVLTKGPFAVIFPALIAAIFLAVHKELGFLKRAEPLPGLAIFLIISAPWFIMMTILHGNEYWGNLWTLEILKRFGHAGSGSWFGLMKSAGESLGFYAGMVFARFLPWSTFLPAAVVSWPALRGVSGREREGLSLIVIWFFSVFSVLVIMGALQSHYLLMLAPAAALLIGRYLARLTADETLGKNIFFVIPFAAAVISAFLAVTIWFIFLFHVMGERISSFSLTCAVLSALLPAAYLARRRHPVFIPVAYFIFTATVFTYISGYCIPLLDKDPLGRFADRISAAAEKGDAVGVGSNHVSYHRLNTYLEDYHVIRVYAYNMSRKSEKYPAENKKMLETFLVASEKRVFCVLTADDYNDFLSPEARGRLYILDRALKWKKIHKLEAPFLKDAAALFLEGDRDAFLAALQEEVLLVSTRP